MSFSVLLLMNIALENPEKRLGLRSFRKFLEVRLLELDLERAVRNRR
jgi:hypothetical protein